MHDICIVIEFCLSWNFTSFFIICRCWIWMVEIRFWHRSIHLWTSWTAEEKPVQQTLTWQSAFWFNSSPTESAKAAQYHLYFESLFVICYIIKLWNVSMLGAHLHDFQPKEKWNTIKSNQLSYMPTALFINKNKIKGWLFIIIFMFVCVVSLLGGGGGRGVYSAHD